jgi:hypothetical protein
MSQRFILSASLLALATLASCSNQPDQPAANQSAQPAARESATPAPDYANMAIEVAGPGEPGGLPDDRTPLSEGPITPGSAEDAGQVVQHYAALLEQPRFDEAKALWQGDAPDLASQYAHYARIGANIGKPGRVDAGAGQLYVEVPIQIYGRRDDGQVVNGLGSVTLHRVNDVDGSTPEQRQWRITKIDADPKPLTK